MARAQIEVEVGNQNVHVEASKTDDGVDGKETWFFLRIGGVESEMASTRNVDQIRSLAKALSQIADFVEVA